MARDKANNGSWLCAIRGCYSINENYKEKCGRLDCVGRMSTELLLALKELMERAVKMVAPDSDEEVAVHALYEEAKISKGKAIEGMQLPPELRGNVMELVAKWTEFILERTFGLTSLPYTVGYLYRYCHVMTTRIYLEKKEQSVRGGRVAVTPGLILVECELLQRRKLKEETGKEDLDRLKEARMKLKSIERALDAVNTYQKGKDAEKEGKVENSIRRPQIQLVNSREKEEVQMKKDERKPKGVTKEEVTGTRGRGKTFEHHNLKLEAERKVDRLMLPTESQEMPENWNAPTRTKFYYLMKPIGGQTRPTMLIATMPLRSNFILFGQSLERIDSAVLDKYQHCSYIRFNWSDTGKIYRPPYYARMKEKKIDLVRSPAEKRRREKDQEKQQENAKPQEEEKQANPVKRQKIVEAHQDVREKGKMNVGPTKEDKLRMRFKDVKVQGRDTKLSLNFDTNGNCLCCPEKQCLLYCGNPVIFMDWATMVLFRKNYAAGKQGTHPIICVVQFATPFDLQCVVENQKETLGHVLLSGANDDVVLLFMSQCLYSSSSRERLTATHFINSYNALHSAILTRDASVYSIRPIKRNVDEEEQLAAYTVANYMETCSKNCLDYALIGAKFEEVGWQADQKMMMTNELESILVLEPSMTGKDLIEYTAPPKTSWKPKESLWNQIGKLMMEGEEQWYQLLKRDMATICEERQERKREEEER